MDSKLILSVSFFLISNSKTMVKTIRQWFEEFPEPYRKQALENTDKEELDENINDAKMALAGGFNWNSSPQGFSYWDKFYDTLGSNG